MLGALIHKIIQRQRDLKRHPDFHLPRHIAFFILNLWVKENLMKILCFGNDSRCRRGEMYRWYAVLSRIRYKSIIESLSSKTTNNFQITLDTFYSKLM